MTDLKLQNINHVKILAKIVAQDTREDQGIYKTMEGRDKIFRFKPIRKCGAGVVELVRYTPEDKRGDVLSDNGIGEPGIIESKPQRKSKPRKA